MPVERDAATADRRTWVERVRRLQSHRAVRRALALCGALLVLASFYYLWIGLSPWLSSHEWRTLSPRWGLLAAALGAFSLCPVLRGLIWWCLLSGIGAQATVIECMLVQARANLIKYVPGGFWELAGKAYLSRHTGSMRSTVGIAATLDLGCILATGLAVSLTLMPLSTTVIGIPPVVRWPALALVTGGVYSMPWVLNRVASRTPAHWFPHGVPNIVPRRFHLSVLVMLVHWVTAGLGLALLVAALGADQLSDLWFSTYSLAVSATIGLMVVIAPAGIGVREAVLTQVLGQRLPLGPASCVAILSRVGLVAGELIAFVALVAVARGWRYRVCADQQPARSPRSD